METIARKSWYVDVNAFLPWEDVDFATQEQIAAAAMHPHVGGNIAIMPDTHVGYGVPIGSVLQTDGVVIPNAVGVDIGCGIAALNTGLKYDDGMDAEFWETWKNITLSTVPVGFNWFNTPQKSATLWNETLRAPIQDVLESRGMYQLGTLGGGNHFMEVQMDEDDFIWLMVHSGSRKIGLTIAGYYHRLARERNERLSGRTRSPKDLEPLSLELDEGQDYMHDMEWAKRYASSSRRKMLDEMANALIYTWHLYGVSGDTNALRKGGIFKCNRSHNDAKIVEGGKSVVHRKGAMHLPSGEDGPIPGSMGTGSFIVRGKGNMFAYDSTSHGAGRRLGRNAAKKAITQEDFETSLAGTFSTASMKYVDEAPGAYKDIGEVIARQSELLDVVTRLRPVITLKGDSRAKED